MLTTTTSHGNSTRPDVIVVGAGIVGAACARELAREGLAVLVVDRAPSGGGTTASGMGHVAVMDDSDAQFSLCKLSQDLWLEVADELPASVERDPCGALWVAADDEEMDAARAKHAWYAEHDVATELVDGPTLRSMEPALREGLAGGLRMIADHVVYPPTATTWMLARAVDDGATVNIGTAARTIEDGVVVMENGERLGADIVVDAAGHHALDLLASPLPGLDVRPRKGHLIITDRYPGYCRHQLIELGYLKSAHSHATSSVAFNLQPRATGQMLLGSSRQYDRADRTVEPAMLHRMIERAREYAPSITKLRAIRAWTGFRAATEDKLPVIGRHPTMNKTVMACGHEGLGITTSLGTGRLVADIVLDRSSAIDRAPYRADRGTGPETQSSMNSSDVDVPDDNVDVDADGAA